MTISTHFTTDLGLKTHRRSGQRDAQWCGSWRGQWIGIRGLEEGGAESLPPGNGEGGGSVMPPV
ncbi:MAG TPA: hypothetical protein VNY05_23280 [Candidatus Acidoferrales bacterium]|jgi:hypothetical protein|nr:hypothetical protein [Candidatus Acidoferrales bacterium]